jgi:hypothetical protein
MPKSLTNAPYVETDRMSGIQRFMNSSNVGTVKSRAKWPLCGGAGQAVRAYHVSVYLRGKVRGKANNQSGNVPDCFQVVAINGAR